MSHAVTTTITINIQDELKIIDELKSQIENMDRFWKENACDSFNDLLNRCELLRNTLLELDGKIGSKTTTDGRINNIDQVLLDYQKLQDNLVKRIANIKNSFDYQGAIQTFLNKKDNDINEIILNNGTMAYEAIEALNNEKSYVTKQLLLDKIAEIRNSETLSEVFSQSKETMIDNIINMSFAKRQQNALIQLVDDINTPQELMDFGALIESSKVANLRINEIKHSIVDALQSLNFSIREIQEDVVIEQENNIKMKQSIIAYNDLSKKISIDLYSDGRMEYDMGNYEGHMCEADSGKFRDILAEKYEMSSPRIIRHKSNNRPVLRALKQREKE